MIFYFTSINEHHYPLTYTNFLISTGTIWQTENLKLAFSYKKELVAFVFGVLSDLLNHNFFPVPSIYL